MIVPAASLAVVAPAPAELATSSRRSPQRRVAALLLVPGRATARTRPPACGRRARRAGEAAADAGLPAIRVHGLTRPRSSGGVIGFLVDRRGGAGAPVVAARGASSRQLALAAARRGRARRGHRRVPRPRGRARGAARGDASRPRPGRRRRAPRPRVRRVPRAGRCRRPARAAARRPRRDVARAAGSCCSASGRSSELATRRHGRVAPPARARAAGRGAGPARPRRGAPRRAAAVATGRRGSSSSPASPSRTPGDAAAARRSARSSGSGSPARRLASAATSESLELRASPRSSPDDPLGLRIAGRVGRRSSAAPSPSRAPFTEPRRSARPPRPRRAPTLEAAERLAEPPRVARADRLAAYRLLARCAACPTVAIAGDRAARAAARRPPGERPGAAGDAPGGPRPRRGGRGGRGARHPPQHARVPRPPHRGRDGLAPGRPRAPPRRSPSPSDSCNPHKQTGR